MGLKECIFAVVEVDRERDCKHRISGTPVDDLVMTRSTIVWPQVIAAC